MIEPLPVRGEPAALSSVVHNLIDNAVRACGPRGQIALGITIEAEAETAAPPV